MFIQLEFNSLSNTVTCYIFQMCVLPVLVQMVNVYPS